MFEYRWDLPIKKWHRSGTGWGEEKIASVLEDLINSIRYEFSKAKTLDLKKVKMAVICEGIVRTEEDHVHKT